MGPKIKHQVKMMASHHTKPTRNILANVHRLPVELWIGLSEYTVNGPKTDGYDLYKPLHHAYNWQISSLKKAELFNAIKILFISIRSLILYFNFSAVKI